MQNILGLSVLHRRPRQRQEEQPRTVHHPSSCCDPCCPSASSDPYTASVRVASEKSRPGVRYNFKGTLHTPAKDVNMESHCPLTLSLSLSLSLWFVCVCVCVCVCVHLSDCIDTCQIAPVLRQPRMHYGGGADCDSQNVYRHPFHSGLKSVIIIDIIIIPSTPTHLALWSLPQPPVQWTLHRFGSDHLLIQGRTAVYQTGR